MPDRHSRTKRIGIAIAALIGLVLLFAGIIVNVSVQKTQPTPSTGIAYGVNVDILAMIPGIRYTVRTATNGDFFALAAQPGINMLRITDVPWPVTRSRHMQI